MVFIYDALRVPIGKANGIYKNILPERLFADILQAFILRNPSLFPEEIIVANAFGTGGNMGRYAALLAGELQDISVTTIDSQCSGGLKAVEMSMNAILSQQCKVVAAGGMESSSLAPYRSYKKHDARFNETEPFYSTATFAPGPKVTLLDAAKNVAHKYHVSKADMLEWAENSHKKALTAKTVLGPFLLQSSDLFYDQSIRTDTNLTRFVTSDLIDRTVSAHYNDGAAAVLLGSEGLGLPLAKILHSASVGWNPSFAPEGVIAATEKVLSKTALQISDIDFFEINESFALIPLIFAQHFGMDKKRINVLGGNLAYGHPFGASGTINLIHLIAALKDKGAKRGLVVLPAAGGLATAMIIENVI